MLKDEQTPKIMKKQQVCIVLGLIGISVANISAVPILQNNPSLFYQDIMSIGKNLDSDPDTTQTPASFAGTFNILIANSGNITIPSGYLSGTDTDRTFSDIGGFVVGGPWKIDSASAFFYIKDADGNHDIVDINLGPDDFAVVTHANNSKIILGGSLAGAEITFLNNNGTLGFTVTAIQDQNSGTHSKFTIDYAQLQVTGRSSVPDGGATLSMLALSMLGFVFTKRKFAAAK